MNKFYSLLIFILAGHGLLFSETKYKINNLDLNQTHSCAYCINNLGEVCGTFDVTNSEGRYNSAFYWSSGMGLMELPEGAFFTPYSMNDAGLIVGDKYTITKMPNGSNRGLFKGHIMNVGGLTEDLDYAGWLKLDRKNSEIML